MSDRMAWLGILLVIVCTAYFASANAGNLSLRPLDDCHYAQKGVEMLEHGSFFTVRWGGAITTQHPPLHFWILSRSFALFGQNDFSARLPNILMALGTLLLVFQIGRRLLDPASALAGSAMLLLSFEYLDNTRRVMLETATCFWSTLFFYLLLIGMRRRQALVWLALPLAGGILTKSVVGLMPLGVLGCALLFPSIRRTWELRWLFCGVALGLVLGSSWSVHQGLVHGWDFVHAHYFGEVGRVARDTSWIHFFVAYPSTLMREFQPVLLPGVAGAILLWRRGGRGRLLTLWIFAWIFLANFSSARISRYVWPTLVPLSICSGYLLARWSRKAAITFALGLVPLALIVLGTLYWVQPSTLTRDQDRPFKQMARAFASDAPEPLPVPLLGEPSWRLANPLMYYNWIRTVPIVDSVDEALSAAARHPRSLLLAETSRVPAIADAGASYRVLHELDRWVLVQFADENSGGETE